MGEMEKFSPKDKTNEVWKKKKNELDQKNVREFKVSNVSLSRKLSHAAEESSNKARTSSSQDRVKILPEIN